MAVNDRRFSRPDALYFCSLAVVVAYVALDASASWVAWAAALLSVVVTRRHLSPLVSLLVAYLVFCLMIAPALNDHQGQWTDSDIYSVAALWVIATCIGGVVARRGGTLHESKNEGKQRFLPALLVSFAGLLATVVAIRQGAYGLSGQLTGQSAGGALGLLSGVGPAFAAGALLSALRQGATPLSPARLAALLLVAAHCALLTLSGFRGAAPFYILAIVISNRDVRDHVIRGIPSGGGKRLLATAAAGILMGGLFLAGAAVRTQVFNETGTSSTSMTLRSVVARFDSSIPLTAAWEHRDDAATRSLIGPEQQAIAIVPRALYPEKPVIDYGTRVAVLVYNNPPGTRNSETLTAFGDAIVGMGLFAALLLAIVYTAVVDSAFRLLRARVSTLSAILSVPIVLSAVSIEGTFILNLVGALRLTGTILILYGLTYWLTGGRTGQYPRDEGLRGSRSRASL